MRRTVFFFESGRLGNQVFQYMALKNYDPHARLILVGLHTLKELINDDWIQCTDFTSRFLLRLITRIGWNKIYAIAATYRLITLVDESSDMKDTLFYERKGLFSKIVLFNKSYFQVEKNVEDFFNAGFKLQFRQNLLNQANEIIDKLPEKRENLYFVHIRRGDYIHWPSQLHSAVLPYQWYKAQMEKIKNINPSAHFLITTDDPYYVMDLFGNQVNCTLSRADDKIDLLLMSLCKGGGILSASSFSLISSIINKTLCANNSIHFAPLFWGGFRKNEWYPKKVMMSCLKYERVHFDVRIAQKQVQ